MKPTILTRWGLYFNIAEPEKTLEAASAHTIAHALSNICRFTGHVIEFYSVAQHSVMVSRLVPPEHALAGLMHDAAEAFIGDVSSPLKAMLPEYKAIEKRVEAAVFGSFGLPALLDPCVKHADLVMLATEKRDLMPQRAELGGWECIAGIEPMPEILVAMSSLAARRAFLARFEELI